MIDKKKIFEAIDSGKIIWRKHTILRMIERNNTREDILSCIMNGEIINYYKDDKPFPSYLVLYFVHNIPLHVVFSFDKINNFIKIITV